MASSINIKTQDLQQLASNMQNWLTQINMIHNQMMSRVRNLEGSWNDPQSHQFLDTLTGISDGLKGHTDSLERSRKLLQTMAKNMEDQARTFQQGMRNVR
jgi:uncharacterized protein YukE